MAVYHRTQRLQIYGEKPEVTKLFGDRYRMVVRCKAARDTEAWYNANKDQIFASFGTLYSAQMSVDGIDPRAGEAYPDMCLVSNSASYTQTGEYVISFVYETLTAVWTKEQDDEVTSTDNGLRVLERSEVAKVDGFPIVQLSGILPPPFNTSKVVLSNMGNASNYFVLLVKADSANTIYWRATNEALATYTSSFTTANNDQWEYKVIYTPISIDQLEIGYDGTNYSTFDLSEFYVVSQSSDWQNNIVESFINFEVTVDNPSTFTDTVVFTGSNGNTATGTNVQSGDTGSVLSPYDEDDVGVATITDGGKTLYLANFQDQTGAESDAQVGRVVTRWAEAGILSRTEDFVGSQDSLVIEAIGPDPSTPAGFSLASKQESNYEGFQTNRFTFLKNDVQLSQTEDKVGSQLAISQQWFNPSADKTLSGYSLASKNTSDFEGIETVEYRFLKPSVLSRSIQTRNNGKLIIETVEAFNEVPTANTVGAVQIGDEVSDVEGIPTRRYTFAKGEGQISVSTRPAESSLAGCTYVTVRSLGTPVTPTGVLVAESETESDGYITYEKTAIQGTIAGVKQTYLDVVDVEVPGTVECTTVSVSSGGVSGTLAVPLVTPRRNKKVAATVTVEITNAPPNTASLAYDLGQISCSVTTTNVSLSVGPGSTVTVGTNSVVSDTGYVQNFGASANIGVYPGCYLTTGSSTGSVSYITSSQPVASGNTITRNEANSSRNTSCTGTGSSSATGYVETGIISRKSRPILTTLDGTTYYEVVTWSVS